MELRDLPSPVPGKNQVSITVKSCGVNFPDVLMLADKYQFKPALPFPPGGGNDTVARAIALIEYAAETKNVTATITFAASSICPFVCCLLQYGCQPSLV